MRKTNTAKNAVWSLAKEIKTFIQSYFVLRAIYFVSEGYSKLVAFVKSLDGLKPVRLVKAK